MNGYIENFIKMGYYIYNLKINNYIISFVWIDSLSKIVRVIEL